MFNVLLFSRVVKEIIFLINSQEQLIPLINNVEVSEDILNRQCVKIEEIANNKE